MNCYRTDLTFLRLLRECYFHPSRDAAFPSPEMKRMAHTAMLLLWEKDVILLFGNAYGRKQIRRSMIFRMRKKKHQSLGARRKRANARKI